MRQPTFVTTSAVFLVSTLVSFYLLVRLPVLYDADSYYHLAVAQLYGTEGTVDALPWPRFSLLHDAFADKEWLFHILLIPFVRLMDPTVGGRLLLAVLNGAIYTLLAGAAMRIWHWQGALVPAWIWIAAIPFAGRLNRLRPEVLGLLLLLVAIACVARRRHRWLGVVMFLYTLSYTAFHALLGLCFLWFVERWWRTRRPDWSMIAWPTLGAALAFLVHPHFPRNLRFWVVQNVQFFSGIDNLDVGNEIYAGGLHQIVNLEIGWWLGLVVLALATTERSESAEATPEARDRFAAAGIAALAFGVLFVLMGRFGIYFVPTATLTLFAGIGVLRRTGTPFVRLPLGRSRSVPLVPVVVALGIAILPGYARVEALWTDLFTDVSPVPYEVDRRLMAAEVPDGARVAAHWGDAEFYVFYAPRARYLNLLDPLFMALPYPELYAVQRGIFENREPDVPLQLVSALESDWIAFWRGPRPELFDRLMADPRIEPRYAGHSFLARVRPDGNAGFVLDWRVDVPKDPSHPVDLRSWTYPRLPPDTPPRAAGLPSPRAVEGYVDVRRLPDAAQEQPCLRFSTRLPVDVSSDAPRRFELVAAGPSKLAVGGRELADSAGLGVPALGKGVMVELLPEEERELVVITCNSVSGLYGFYLLERPR